MRIKQKKKFIRAVDGAVETYINTTINAKSEEDLLKSEMAWIDLNNFKRKIMLGRNKEIKSQLIESSIY